MNIDHNFNDSIFLMEDICMKKILFSLLTLTMVFTASCGNSNKTNTGSTVGTSPITTFPTTGSLDSVKSALNAAIDNNQFTTTSTSYKVVHYVYASTCTTKDGWFGIDYTSCKNGMTEESRTLISNINIDSKKAELKSIVNAMVNYRYGVDQYTGKYIYEILTSDNKNYTIYFGYPIQANPAYHYDSYLRKGYSKQVVY